MLNFAQSIEEYREHVPALKDNAYFETASTGLIPDFVHDGVSRYLEERYLRGGDSYWKYEDGDVWLLDMLDRSRSAIAEMINADKSEIAFGQSSTQMFTMVTEGIDYNADDNVVVPGEGWIGNRYAWQKKEDEGLEVRYAMAGNGYITAEDLISLCDEHTRAVTVNVVESFNGYRVDLQKLGDYCNEHGILLFCDAVQALGVLNVDVSKYHIDFMVGNDYKWMQNYSGTGYAYISHDVQKMIRHWGAGWMSDAERFCTSKNRLTLRDDAGRFEIGYPNVSGIYGLGLVAEQYNRLGRREIEEYVLGLSRYLRERIKQTDGIRLKYNFEDEINYCQTVIVSIDDKINISNEDFAQNKVTVQLKPGNNGDADVRLAMHYYNNAKDIDRFFEVIESVKDRQTK